MPRVSVIIPTYNRADVLPRAMDSVLDQTLADFELLVVDDASADDTEDVVRGYRDDRVRYVAHGENRGAAAARNTGIEAAAGEYVAFVDSDDVWDATKLEKQIAALDAKSGQWVAAYTDFDKRLSGADGRVRGLAARLLDNDIPAEQKEGGAELRPAMLTDRLVTAAGSTLLVDADVAARVGGFDASLPRYQDPEFVLRVLEEGKLAYVDEPLVTLGSAGDPSGGMVREAADKYLGKHADLVADLEAEGYEVRARYDLLTAKQYLGEGRLFEGLRYLRRAKVDPGEYPGVVWRTGSGLRRRPSVVAGLGLLAVALAVGAGRTR